jgi:hypothetical protein
VGEAAVGNSIYCNWSYCSLGKGWSWNLFEAHGYRFAAIHL